MLPFGVKYKSKHDFSSDDDDDEDNSLTHHLNNKSTNGIDQLLTNNKKRKEKEKEFEKNQVIKKKKQKIERESDTIKELKDRIEMFEEDEKEEDEWEEEVVPNMEDEEPNIEKEDEYIQFTINNNSDKEEEENSPSKKRKVIRKTKKEQLLNCSINFVQLLIYFNYQFKFIEFTKNSMLQGTILSILEELKLNNDRSIDHLLDTIYKKFKIKKFKEIPNLFTFLDNYEKCIENISKKNIENILELNLLILISLIYNNYKIRYCTKIEILEKKEFKFENWIEIQYENPNSASENTFKKLILKNKTFKIEKIKINNLEKYYKKLDKKTNQIPIMVISFDFLNEFNFTIRNTTSKYLICKYPNTLIGKENYLRIETLMNNLIFDFNQDLINLLNPPKIVNSIPIMNNLNNLNNLNNGNGDINVNLIKKENEIIDLENEDDLIVHVIDSENEKDEQEVIIKNIINSKKSINKLNEIKKEKEKEKEIIKKENEKLIIKNNNELLQNNFEFLNNFIENDEILLKEIKTLILKEIPTSIQEFQTHPIYIIEKFITKYDTIYPKDRDPIDKIKTHSIYLREWIKPLHTRDRWLRDHFKKVKLNEKPYKLVKASKFSKNSDITELYGEWQTDDYQVPIVNENDEIPKSDKGSYELWNSKFLPIGCCHISTNNEPLKGLTIVARKLKMDYARAMVGFEFKHKRSIPLYDGIIIHKFNENLLRSEYLKYQQVKLQKLITRKNQRIVNNWKKLVKGLLAREYVANKYANREENVHLHDIISINNNNTNDSDDDENDENDRDDEDEEMSDVSEDEEEMSENEMSDDEKKKEKSKKKKKNSSSPPSAASSGPTVQRMLASGKIVEFEEI